MSPKDEKPRSSGRRKKDETSVLGSLPATRPNRLGRRRDGDAAPTAPSGTNGTPAKREAKATPTAAKAKTKAKAKPAAASPKPKSKTSRPKAKTPTAQPLRPARTPTPTPAPEPLAGGPRPVRAGAPSLDAPQPDERPAATEQSGTELVTTVVQAAGELAQIGLTVGGQILKRAVDRLPKP